MLFRNKTQPVAAPAAEAPQPAAPPQPEPVANAGADAAPQHTPEEARRLAETADQRAAAFGRIMAMMTISPRHSKLTLREINNYLTPAVSLGQFAMVGAQSQQGGPTALAAVAWWALVSPEIDKRLTDSRSEFLHLEGSEWKSGDQPWIIDAVGDQRVVSELLKMLAERTFKERPAKLRASMPDGRIAVGRLEEAKPAAT